MENYERFFHNSLDKSDIRQDAFPVDEQMN